MNQGMALILARLESISRDLGDLKQQVGEHGKLAQQFEIWKAETNLRLQAGCDRMDALEDQIEERVEKRVLLAYIAGAASASAGLSVGLMKLLGG